MSNDNPDQPLLPISLLDYSYEDAYAALDEGGALILDLNDEDTAWALRSGPTSPETTVYSSGPGTASTRTSDLSENDNLWLNLDLEDMDMPDAWAMGFNGNALRLDVQLSEEIQKLGVMLPPMDSDDMMLFPTYGDGMMDLETLESVMNSMDSMGGMATLSAELSTNNTTSTSCSGQDNLIHQRYSELEGRCKDHHTIDTASAHTSFVKSDNGPAPKPLFSCPVGGSHDRIRGHGSRFVAGDGGSINRCQESGWNGANGLEAVPNATNTLAQAEQHILHARLGFVSRPTTLYVKPEDKCSSLDINSSPLDEAILKSPKSRAAIGIYATNLQTGCLNSTNNRITFPVSAVASLSNSPADSSHTDLSDSRSSQTGTGSTASSELETEYSLEDGNDDYLLDIEAQKERVLDRLMVRVHEMFTTSGPISCRAHAVAESSNTAGVNHDCNLTGSKCSKKRRIDHERSEDNDSGSDNDNKPNKRRRTEKQSAASPQKPDRKLACPYFKHNPRRHRSSRACCGPGWDGVHRIKGHLYRVHAMPPHCRRCYSIFDDEDQLTEHARSPDSCIVTDTSPPEGFSKDQELKLKGRRTMFQAESEEEKWKIVYLVLFPNTALGDLPSPYYDASDESIDEPGEEISPRSAEISQFDAYLRRELPRKIRKKLQGVLEGKIGPIEETLKNDLEALVRDCQESLTRNFFDVVRPSEVPEQRDAASQPEQSHSDAPPSGANPTDQPPRANADALVQFLVPPDSVPVSWPDVAASSNHTTSHAISSDSAYFSLIGDESGPSSDDVWLESVLDSAAAFDDFSSTVNFPWSQDSDASYLTLPTESILPTYTGKGKGRADCVELDI